eukprot:194995-Chlamydomonas_euryale.AAC.2
MRAPASSGMADCGAGGGREVERGEGGLGKGGRKGGKQGSGVWRQTRVMALRRESGWAEHKGSEQGGSTAHGRHAKKKGRREAFVRPEGHGAEWPLHGCCASRGVAGTQRRERTPEI